MIAMTTKSSTRVNEEVSGERGAVSGFAPRCVGNREAERDTIVGQALLACRPVRKEWHPGMRALVCPAWA